MIDECGYIEGYIGKLNIILSAIPRHVLSEHSSLRLSGPSGSASYDGQAGTTVSDVAVRRRRNGLEDFSFRKVYILAGLEGLRTMESRVIG